MPQTCPLQTIAFIVFPNVLLYFAHLDVMCVLRLPMQLPLASFLLLLPALISDSGAVLLLMTPLLAASCAVLLLMTPLIADSDAVLLLMMLLITDSGTVLLHMMLLGSQSGIKMLLSWPQS